MDSDQVVEQLVGGMQVWGLDPIQSHSPASSPAPQWSFSWSVFSAQIALTTSLISCVLKSLLLSYSLIIFVSVTWLTSVDHQSRCKRAYNLLSSQPLPTPWVSHFLCFHEGPLACLRLYFCIQCLCHTGLFLPWQQGPCLSSACSPLCLLGM